MRCPKCRAENSLALEEEFTSIGKVAGLSCNQCSYRTGLLFDFRKRLAQVEVTGPAQDDEPHVNVRFTGDNIEIIEALAAQSKRDGFELQDDIAALVDAYRTGKMRFVKNPR